MKDIFGQALLDFQNKAGESPLLLHNEYGPPETIPLEQYFIAEAEFSNLDHFALSQVRGKILDVGAATGRHAMYLQRLDQDITAMDISPSCGTIMGAHGIKKIVIEDIFNYNKEKFDTIIMLMNGIGIPGSVAGLEQLLIHLKSILNPDGQLLVDSSDISYLYEGSAMPENKYFGELSYHYEYKKSLGDPFSWLYIDKEKLFEISRETGWACQIIFEDETDAYLARLQMR